ncbi:MAG TPA: hypothetical protein VEL07_12010 [Planctomycetota bacterium]|nr:hypothetical protein [Planctomycetota bacterium]
MIALRVIAALGIVVATPTAELVIAAAPLQIEVEDNLDQQVFRDGARQYYSVYRHCLVVGQTVWSPAATPFTPVSHDQPSGDRVRTVVTAQGGEIELAHTVSAAPGALLVRHEWTVTNRGGRAYADLALRYGGDTFFAGGDTAEGYFDANVGMVYSTRDGVTGLMGLYGGVESPTERYVEGHYATVWSQLGGAAPLPNTVDPNEIDNGTGIEWRRASLASGATWTVVGWEQWTDSGLLQVIAPAVAPAPAGTTVTVPFTVRNFSTNAATVALSTAATAGWGSSLPGGASVVLAASAQATVDVAVTIPVGAVGTTGQATLIVSAIGLGSNANTASILALTAQGNEVPVPLPVIAVSRRADTRWNAVSGATPEGLARLRAAVAGRPTTEAKLYAWDALAQRFALFPAEPTGGLRLDHGAFVATRVPLALDFSGTGAASPYALVLRPGWNLVGLPPVDGETDHPWSALTLRFDDDGTLIGEPLRTTLTGAGPYAWNGAGYDLAATMASGSGYWITNNHASRALRLVREGTSTIALRVVETVAVDDGKIVERGAPPTPPASSSAGGSGGGGGCGSGGVVAGLGLAVALMLRRRLR